jgi:hypothetical protein
MKKRPIQKGHTFSVRMPEKTRYGIDLLARKYRTQVSAIVTKAVDALLAKEKLTTRNDGELWSLLDKLWSESPGMRIIKLVREAPELATEDEKRIGQALKGLLDRYGEMPGSCLRALFPSDQSDPPILDEFVSLISAYLGVTRDENLTQGDEEKYLLQCDETLLFALPKIAKECGMSVDTFREKYVTEK